MFNNCKRYQLKPELELQVDRGNAWTGEQEYDQESGDYEQEDESASFENESPLPQSPVGYINTNPQLPTLLGESQEVPGYTIYVQIPLGNDKAAGRYMRLSAKTGIYIPANFSVEEPTDLIIYLHGYKYQYPGNQAPIEEYWNGRKFPFFALREEVNNSGKRNVIFIAPSLGPRSEAGSLVRAGGFNSYIDKVTSAINEYIIKRRFRKQSFQPGRIILSAHSGGGLPMLRIIMQGDSYAKKVAECWGFDSLYQGVDEWTRWAKNSGRKLFVYYLRSTAGNALALHNRARNMRLANIVVRKSSRGHYWVPILHLKERINQIGSASTLAPMPGISGRTQKEIAYENGNSSVPDPLQPNSPYHASRFSLHKSDPAFFSFKRKVYEAHVRWAAGRGRPFIPDQPKGNLTTFTDNGKKITVHVRLAEPLQRLLGKARSDAKSENKNVTIRINSGYRSASTQFTSWDGLFTRYYERAVKGNVISRGAYDQASAQKLSQFIRSKLGAPGYSNHQHGRAIDFSVTEITNGKKISAVVSTTDASVRLWKTTWFWHWLTVNARSFGFCPYEAEPWHWEYWSDVDPQLKRCPAQKSQREMSFETPLAEEVQIRTGSYLGMKGVSSPSTVKPSSKNIKDQNDIIIACVSTVEGGFDTVNLYDKGIISWGIMQWSAHAGSLQHILSYIKRSPQFIKSPQQFNLMFGGLDINKDEQFVYKGSVYPIQQPNLPLIKLFRNSTDVSLVDYDAAVAKNWTRIFALAGRDPVVQSLQMEYTKNEIPSALGVTLSRRLVALKKIAKFKKQIPDTTATLNNYQYKISAYLAGSLKARMLYFCMWTNNPSWATIKLFHAIKTFMTAKNLPYDPTGWGQQLKQPFADHFEQVLRSTTVGYWGDAKSAKAKRESRTAKLMKKFTELTSAVKVP